tara:strand:+ start:1197 stop:1556 length:360 start_codon:yes stop_codon:yes gene_type:complete
MDTEKEEIRCFHCNETFKKKPWLILSFDNGDIMYHTCSYLCTTHLNHKLNMNYSDNIVNKEDFTGRDFLRPVINKSPKKDITTGFDMHEIRNEIKIEEERIQCIEDEWFEEDFCEYNSE